MTDKPKSQTKPKPDKPSDLEGRLAALEQVIADGGGRHARLLRRATDKA